MIAGNVDQAEVAKFEALAHRWWDPQGDFKPLHDINPTRVAYLDGCCPLADARVIDVGCGGGILAESLAHRGAAVTGIDAAQRPLAVARLHAAEAGLEDAIRYEFATPEAFAAREPAAFQLVTCLEMLEHVPDASSTVNALAALAAPGGHVVCSTINRTPKAWLLAVLGAEYILRLLPRGTHDYAKLLRPAELARAFRDAGLVVTEIIGMRYNPFTRACSLTSDASVNYLLHARKPGPSDAPAAELGTTP